MKYFLQREGRTYGPYSYDDLKRYQAENRIGPSDLVRREDSQQWEPWQQVLNPAPAAPAETPMPQVAPQQPQFGGFNPPAQQPAQPAFGSNNPPAFGNNPPAFGNNPPAFGGAPQNNPPAFGDPGGFGAPQNNPPAFQPQQPQPGGFGGGFGQQAQQTGQEVAGAFGAFGAQGGFGGQPQQGGFGGQPMGQPGFGGGAVGPMPPDMQWWLVLVIGFFCGIFPLFWLWKQATFVKRIDPQCDATKFYGMGFALLLGGYALSFMSILFATGNLTELAVVFPMIGMVVILGGAVCLILAHFKMRTAIHNYYTMVEPMGINLMDTAGALMTFFFSVYFFQYHFANIAMRKKAMGHPSV